MRQGRSDAGDARRASGPRPEDFDVDPRPGNAPCRQAFLEILEEAGRTTQIEISVLGSLELVEQIIGRRADLKLLSAADGHLGVEFARTHQPRVIIMDINLPGISGIEAMRILRADPSTAHIPIVALSANAMPRDIKRGLEAGFFDYLTKPLKVGEFLHVLDAALAFAKSPSIPRAQQGTES